MEDEFPLRTAAQSRLHDRLSQLGLEDEKKADVPSYPAPTSLPQSAGSPKASALKGARSVPAAKAAAEDDEDLVQRGPPKNWLSDEQLQLQSRVYAPVDQPIVDDGDPYPRRLEDEGFFVPDRPLVPDRSLRAIVSRLLREDLHRQLYFDETGQMVQEALPILPFPTRPFHRGEVQLAPPQLRTTVITPKLLSAVNERWLELTLEFTSLQFTDHPLFSKEDYLGSQLMEQYNEYKRRETVNLTKFYQDKIAALSRELDTLEWGLQQLELQVEAKASDPRAEESRRESVLRIVNVLEQLQEARLLRDEEEGEMQASFKQLYKTWTDIRRWRESMTQNMAAGGIRLHTAPDSPAASAQGPTKEVAAQFAGTGLRLKVRQMATDAGQDELVRRQDEDQEVTDARKLFVYSTKARQLLKKPTPPDRESFDEELTRQLIRKRISRFRRPPGAAVFSPVLEKNGVRVVADELCLPKERERRQAVQKSNIRLTIFVNDKRVTACECPGLQFPSFSAHFQGAKPLRLVDVPRAIKCRISAVGFASERRIADLFIPVPEFGSPPTSQRVEFMGEQFEDAEGRIPELKQRRYGGVLECSTAWTGAGGTDGAALGLESAAQAGGKGERGRLQHRKQMIRATQRQKVDLDPNDPRNAELVELLRRARLAEARGHVFEATPFPRELLLLDQSLKLESARRKVLRARHHAPLVKDPVPLRDSEIPEHLYELVEMDAIVLEDRGRPGTARASPLTVALDVEDEDIVQSHIEAQLKARNKLMKLKRDVAHVSEVVREGPLPEFTFKFEFIDKLFQPRRPLKIERPAPKPVSNPRRCAVVVQVIRAQNVPVRRASGSVNRPADASILPPAEPLRCFVEVSFQSQARRTGSTGAGHAPRWNELLTLPFKPPGDDFSPTNLQQVRDRIFINLFDEVVVNLGPDPRQRSVRSEKHERRWLGEFSVPFTTVYTNGSVEGAFRVDTPLLNLAYEKPQPLAPTLVWVYLTLEPLLPPPPSLLDHDLWLHRSEFFDHCLGWKDRMQAMPQCKTRHIRSLAGDINGEPQLVCCFVTPQPPPEGMGVSVFPRFASLIPFVEDWQQVSGVEDVWCTSAEFLALGRGDWEEHALLLCNYFKFFEKNNNAVGWSSYVLLGYGIPEGKTAYVLRLHEVDGIIDQVLAWNPVTAECFNLKTDYATCPLRSVGCVFNEEDLWANIQAVEEPSALNFNLRNPKCWAPLLTDRFRIRTELRRTVQVPLKYFELPEESYLERAHKIERAIERRFEAWRGGRATRWNYGVCQILRECLKGLEFVRQGRSVGAEDDKELERIRDIYDGMYGFPLNFADTGEQDVLQPQDDNPVIKGVQNTRLHENDDTNIEFALGVFVHPYPNSVASIWVYIALLRVKDSL